MDDETYQDAVVAAGYIIQLVQHIVGEDPAAWVAWYHRQLEEEEGERPAVAAVVREAKDPERRSAIAARAAELYTGEPVEVPTKRGPRPEGQTLRNLAALAALWFLSERLGLQPVMRNPASKSGSVCDAVGDAMNRGYKSAERIWLQKGALVRQHPLFFMALWAALPSAELLGVPSLEVETETVSKLLGRIPPQ